ncbi:uncharacterized protein LOC105697471 isoform X2 [Orussus abietinus]|uniref:uncharacterized protein LOC105697471 isoform X2 n=1 Tax=Orussus abietinus TaxID=222816 RepID=UPI000625CCBD|nr:uncharacterized protein LOC105697471 isoform X2 [Orussus abietinus]
MRKDCYFGRSDYKKRRLKPEALPSLNLPYETDGPECISANNESDISPDNEIHILMGDNSSETHHASQETSTLHVTANDDSPASRDVNNCGNELTVLSLLPTSKCFNSHISLRKVKCKNSVLSYQQLTRAVCTHRRYLQGVSKQMLLFRRRLIEEGFRRGKTIEALQQKLSSTEKRFIEMQIRASIHKLKVIKKLYYDIAKCLA